MWPILLQACLLSLVSVQNLHLLDGGPRDSYCCLGHDLGGLCREKHFYLGRAISLLSLPVPLESPARNITTLFVGTAMFLGLYRILSWNKFSDVASISNGIGRFDRIGHLHAQIHATAGLWHFSIL